MEIYHSPSSVAYCSIQDSSSAAMSSTQQSSCGAQRPLCSPNEHSAQPQLRDRSNTIHKYHYSASRLGSNGDTPASAAYKRYNGLTRRIDGENSRDGGHTTSCKRNTAIAGSKRYAQEPVAVSLISGNASALTGQETTNSWNMIDDERQRGCITDDNPVCLIKRVKAEEESNSCSSSHEKVFTEADLSAEQQRHQADLARIETQAELYSIRKEKELKNLKEELQENKASIRGMKQLIEAAASERSKLQHENKVLKRAIAAQNQQMHQCAQHSREKDKTIDDQKQKINYLQQVAMELFSRLNQCQDSDTFKSRGSDFDEDGDDGSGGPTNLGDDSGPFFGTVH